MSEPIELSGTFHSRVARALVGNGMGLASRIIVQFAQIPLFLHFWTPETYGEWLLLYSIPAYLALADFGMGEAGANAIAHAVAGQRPEEARQTYAAVRMFVTMSVCVLVLVALLLFAALHVQDRFGFNHITGSQLDFTLVGLCLSVVLGLQVGTTYAALRGIGRYADQSMIQSIVALIEVAVIGVTLTLRPTPDTVALSLALVRLGLLLFLGRRLRKFGGALLGRRPSGVLAKLRQLLRPSLAFLAFPIANSILLQGYNILIGSAFGPRTLVIYAACATAARTLQAVLVPIYSILMPEAAILFGKRKFHFLRNLHRAAMSILLPLSPLMGLALIGVTHAAFGFWVQHKVDLDSALLGILVLANVIKVAYYPSFAMIAAANRHKGFALVWLGGALLSLPASLLLVHLKAPPYVVLLPVVLLEVILYIGSLSRALAVLGDRPKSVIGKGPYQAARLARLSWGRIRPRRDRLVQA